MGKKTDVREKRRLKRFFTKTKRDRAVKIAPSGVIEQSNITERELQGTISSLRVYNFLFGIILATIALINLGALQILNYASIREFGILKSVGIFFLWCIIVMIGISKKRDKGLMVALFGISIFAIPLFIIINMVFDGQYESFIEDMLLTVSITSIVMSLITLLTPLIYYNRLWLIAGYAFLCSFSLFLYGSWQGIPVPGEILLGAFIFSTVLGWRWAESLYDSQKTLQAMVVTVMYAHIQTFIAYITVATNIWVILFFL